MTNTPLIKAISALLSCLMLACLAQNVAAQQTPIRQSDQDDVIKVKTDLVQVRAVVTDRKGTLVEGLKQDDFEILENGRPQLVSFFSVVRIGSEPASTSTTDGKSVVVPNPPNESPASDKPVRTVVLFVDTLHLSALSLIRTKQELKQFVDEQITDQDLVGIVTTSGSLGVLGQFMRDRKRLKYAIDKISYFSRPASFFTPYLAAKVLSDGYAPFGGGPISRALTLATQILAAEEFANNPPPPAIVIGRASQILMEESLMRRSTLQTVKAVSNRMAEMPGQRMIAFMSDGFTLLAENGADHDDFISATGRAVRSGVLVYSFSPQGLRTPIEFTAAAPIGGATFLEYTHDAQNDQEETLRNLAYGTGGEAYLNSNDVVGQFKKMLDANRIYYAMAYYPRDEADKKFRNIKVRVKNHPEFMIRTQRGYQPVDEKKAKVATTPQQKLYEAMIAPLPLTDIGVTSSASFLERSGDDAQVTLQIHFAGNLLQYRPQEQKYSFSCEVAVVIVDHTGKTSRSFAESVNAVFTSQQLEKAKQNGYRFSKRLNLTPGLYQLRIGVRDVNGGLMGTSMSWVDVPDLRKKKLTLSSIFLGKEKAEEQAAIAFGANKSPKPALVVGQASFKRDEDVFYRFVLYNASREIQATSGLMLKIEVLQSDVPVYDGPWQPVGLRVIRSDGTGIEIGGRMRMEMAPGIYTLRVTANDPKSKATVQQTIDLELER